MQKCVYVKVLNGLPQLDRVYTKQAMIEQLHMDLEDEAIKNRLLIGYAHALMDDPGEMESLINGDAKGGRYGYLAPTLIERLSVELKSPICIYHREGGWYYVNLMNLGAPGLRHVLAALLTKLYHECAKDLSMFHKGDLYEPIPIIGADEF